MASKHLGFIGLGNMGAPMAGRLLDAGYSLTVFDTRAAALQPFVARGAQAAASPAAVASAVETVLVSLPTPDDRATGRARQPTESPPAARSRRSSICPPPGRAPPQEIAKGLAAERHHRGRLAGERRRRRRAEGHAGGDDLGSEGADALLRPLLEIIGKVFYLGEKPGLGQMMKLANNLLSATAMAISREAMVMGVKAGLDPQGDARCDQRRQRPQHREPGQVSASAILPRTFDFGFTNGAHVQGRQAVPGGSVRRSACRCGSRAQCARCGFSPARRSGRSRTSRPSCNASRSGPASR